MTEKQTKRKCFVVGPIGDEDSEDRTHADWLLEAVILPVFQQDYPDFVVERADKMSRPGSINEQVITALLEAELVIADISTLNANAFYEIGIRHTVQKPIIHMHLKGQRIPFDIASFRSIEFSRHRPRDLEAAKSNLKAFLKTVLAEDYKVDNPVTFSRGKVEFEQTATAPEKLLLEELEVMNSRIAQLENHAVVFRRRPRSDEQRNLFPRASDILLPSDEPASLRIEIRSTEQTVAAQKDFASFVKRWVIPLMGQDTVNVEPGSVSFRRSTSTDLTEVARRIGEAAGKDNLKIEILVMPEE